MLDEKSIEKKLRLQVEVFNVYMNGKHYLEAALTADWMSRFAMFVELEEDKKIELFGTRQTDEPIEGLLNEERRLKAEEWCVMKGGYEKTRHTYQNVQRLR